MAEVETQNGNPNSDSDSDSDGPDIASLLLHARLLQDSGPTQGTNNHVTSKRREDMLAEIKGKMEEGSTSEPKVSGTNKHRTSIRPEDMLAKLKGKMEEGSTSKPEVSGTSREDPSDGLEDMLAKLRAKMVEDLASKLKVPGTSREDPSNGLEDMLAKLRAKMVEDLASKLKVPGTRREDPSDGLEDMLAKLRAKMVEDLASKLKVPGTSREDPSNGLEDMLAKLRAEMVKDLASKLKVPGTSREDPSNGLEDMLAKLQAKMVEDLASKLKVPGTSRADPSNGLEDMLAKLRAKMVEDLASKLKVPGTSSQSSSGGFLKDMLAQIQAKKAEDEDTDPKSEDEGTSSQAGLAGLLLEFAKIQAKIRTSREDPLDWLEDLASKLKVPGTSSQSSLGGFLEDMLAKIQAKMAEDEDTDPKPEDEGNSGQDGLEGLALEFAKIQAKIRTSQRAALEGLVEQLSKIQSIIGAGTKDYSQYLPLYRATLAGDWESAKQFIEHNNDTVTATVNHSSETALYIAVEAGKSHVHFVEKLVEVMSDKDLEVQNDIGNTALSVAAMVGNTAAAKILVSKNPHLLYISNKLKYLPVHEAAQYARKHTLVYLRKFTDANTEPCPYIGDTGFTHLVDVMIAEFYDVALDLIENYPQLATMEVEGFDSPLTVMAKKVSAFPSGTHLNLWECLVYSGIQVKLEKQCNPNNGDIENASSHPRIHTMQVHASICFKAVYQRLHFMLSKVLGFFAPHTKDKKLVHCQALQLVKSLCEAIRSSNNSATHIRCTLEPIIEAAINDIPEVIEEIVDALPIALWSRRKEHYIFQLAVVNRCEKVFNLVYQMGDHKQHILTRRDGSGNNILHLAGQMAPPHKLNLVSGAALQMQREIQWYKEVEKFVTHAQRLKLNSSKKTPAMVFSEEHKHLVAAGEKWMKDTATSCTIAAALIVTMVFAAAITVPGGIGQENGKPIFSKRSAFKLFFISNAISLFTSTTSLLMFLSILTARYAEQDFLFTLPNRLIIGLVTLFVSTTTMMIAFSSTLYLVFGEGDTWSIFPIVGLACLPVTSFVTLQFPLLVDVITSTYGRGIFGKQSCRRLY